MKFSPALQTILDQANSKKAWSQALLTALGTTLIFKCNRDPNPAAVSPFDTGTLFYQASLSGPPRILSNAFVNLGYSTNSTTQLGADLTTGKSVLRIEANGHWIEGSLGLLTSTCDFRVRANPTADIGISLKNISISPRRGLSTGIGPLAPELTADTTVKAVIEDMTYPAVPFVVGELKFVLQREHLVFEDDELANEMGDIRITQVSKTVIFGQFEFGATRLDMNKALNSEADVPVEQGVIYCKPFGVWPTYPFLDTQRQSRDLTYPQAFRVKLLRADGTVKKILQMRDGLPINDPSLQYSGWGSSEKKPMRPHWNCAMMLPWQSHLPKVSSNLSKYFNGVEPDATRPSQCKEAASTNAAIPLATGDAQVNSQLQFNAAPQWPIPWDVYGGSPELKAMNTFDDPYLYDTTKYNQPGGRCNISGWDYEIGSISLHDHAAFLGGPRHDRACVPHMVAMFASDRTAVRVKGKVPFRTMINAYGLAMFNSPHHYVQDIHKCTGVPSDIVMGGEITYIGGRYTGGVDAVKLKEKRTIALGARCRDGKPTWGGWQRDHLHSSFSPNLWTIFFNSPMHLICGTMNHTTHIAAQPSAGTPTASAFNYWMEREGAWRWLQYTVQWKAATKHFLGLKRADIERNFQLELEQCYKDIYIPTKVTNDPGLYFDGLRKLGMHGSVSADDAPDPTLTNPPQRNKWIDPNHDTKVYYYGHMLVLMRQFGLWKVMRAKSETCRIVLDFLIECLDKFAIDAIYHTEGRCSVMMRMSELFEYNDPNMRLPNDWAEWNLKVFPKKGQMDMVTEEDGTISTGVSSGQNATLHMRTQYVMMRSIYFPEHPHPLLAACQTMIRGFYDKHSQHVAEAEGPTNQRWRDWQVRWANHGILKAPSVLESATL